jgi:hypothetical protein
MLGGCEHLSYAEARCLNLLSNKMSFIEKILFKISVKIYRSAWHKISYAMDDIYILVSYTYLCIWYSLLSILHVANMDLSHNID